MNERPVGSSGLVVSAVGLGCNQFGSRVDERGAVAIVDAAFEAGITFFDTAESYGDGASETLLGRALRGRREQAVIATKFGGAGGVGTRDLPRGSREYIRGAIEGSLARLGIETVDLYQYHRPDGVTPLEETLGALDELVAEAKVRFAGSSNLTTEQVVEADEASRTRALRRFVSAQNHYSLVERSAEQELLPACERLGIGLIPYFPLARGLLTGKYRRDRPAPAGTRLEGSLAVDAEMWDRLEALEAFGARHGVALLDVAIGGLLTRPAVCSVIAGATRAEQVRQNAAAGAWVPSVEQLAELEQL